jgi:hypothetical protein
MRTNETGSARDDNFTQLSLQPMIELDVPRQAWKHATNLIRPD